MVNYPGGINKDAKKSNTSLVKSKSAANRGMELEKIINQANIYYSENNLAVITKRPTPINVVRVDYSKGARIVDAFFEKQSTTDYNGIFAGHYFDFEAKSTNSKTSFPLNNISKHQIVHLEKVLKAGGIGFFIIQFTVFNENFVIDAKYVIEAYLNGVRKSLTYEMIKEKGMLIPISFNPILDYLPIVKQYFCL